MIVDKIWAMLGSDEPVEWVIIDEPSKEELSTWELVGRQGGATYYSTPDGRTVRHFPGRSRYEMLEKTEASDQPQSS